MRVLFSIIFILMLAACGGGGAAAGGPGPREVAIYGDSINTGTHSTSYTTWQPAVWSPTPAQHIAQLAGVVALDYSQDGGRAQDARIHPDGAQLVVLRYGVADLVRGTDLQAWLLEVARLVAEARARGAGVLITGLPHTAPPIAPTAAWDAALRRLAGDLGVPFVDVQSLAFDPAHDLADPTHPAQGYSRRIGAAVAAAISVHMQR
jgi:acyl-CoA thioesterase-1